MEFSPYFLHMLRRGQPPPDLPSPAKIAAEMPDYGLSPEEQEARRSSVSLKALPIRVGTSVLGAVVGGVAGTAAAGGNPVGGWYGGMAGGGAGSALGEWLAQKFEVGQKVRDDTNLTSVAVQGAVGAVPLVGKARHVAEAAASGFRPLLKELPEVALKQAGLGATATAGMTLAEEGRLPTPAEVGVGAVEGGVLGGALHGLIGGAARLYDARPGNMIPKGDLGVNEAGLGVKRTPPVEAPPPPPAPDGFTGAPPRQPDGTQPGQRVPFPDAPPVGPTSPFEPPVRQDPRLRTNPLVDIGEGTFEPPPPPPLGVGLPDLMRRWRRPYAPPEVRELPTEPYGESIIPDATLPPAGVPPVEPPQFDLGNPLAIPDEVLPPPLPAPPPVTTADQTPAPGRQLGNLWLQRATQNLQQAQENRAAQVVSAQAQAGGAPRPDLAQTLQQGTSPGFLGRLKRAVSGEPREVPPPPAAPLPPAPVVPRDTARRITAAGEDGGTGQVIFDKSGTGYADATALYLSPTEYQIKTADTKGNTGKLNQAKEWAGPQPGRPPQTPLEVAGSVSPVLVHQREDGTFRVVDGHQRVNLARRLLAEGKPVPKLKIQVIPRDVDVPTAQRMGAFINLQQDSITATDLARVLRTGPLTEGERGVLSLDTTGRRTLEKGEGLATLHPSVFNEVLNGNLHEDVGAEIGKVFPNQADHVIVAKMAGKRDFRNLGQMQQFMREVQAAGFKRKAPDADPQGVLFEREAPESVQAMWAIKSDLIDTLKRDAVHAKTFLARAVKEGWRGENRGVNVDKAIAVPEAEQARQMAELVDTFLNGQGFHASQEASYVAGLLADGQISRESALKNIKAALQRDFDEQFRRPGGGDAAAGGPAVAAGAGQPPVSGNAPGADGSGARSEAGGAGVPPADDGIAFAQRRIAWQDHLKYLESLSRPLTDVEQQQLKLLQEQAVRAGLREEAPRPGPLVGDQRLPGFEGQQGAKQEPVAALPDNFRLEGERVQTKAPEDQALFAKRETRADRQARAPQEEASAEVADADADYYQALAEQRMSPTEFLAKSRELENAGPFARKAGWDAALRERGVDPEAKNPNNLPWNQRQWMRQQLGYHDREIALMAPGQAEGLARNGVPASEWRSMMRRRFNNAARGADEALRQIVSVNDDGSYTAVPRLEPRDRAVLREIYSSGPKLGVASKEALQNAFTALRRKWGADVGQRGQIDMQVITRDRPGRPKNQYGEVMQSAELVIRDNGIGMSANDLGTVMIDVLKSGTDTFKESIGGYGLAKLPIYSGRQTTVESFAREADGTLRGHRMVITPGYFTDPNFKVDIIPIPVPDGADSGTTLRIAFDYDTGISAMKEKLAALVGTHSVDRSGTIRIEQVPGGIEQYRPIETLAERAKRKNEAMLWATSDATDANIEKGGWVSTATPTAPEPTPFMEGTGDGYTYAAYRSVERHDTEEALVKVYLQNQGMTQYVAEMGDRRVPGKNIPKAIMVDISDTVPTEDPFYPWEPNREGIKDHVAKQLGKLVNDHIINEAITNHKAAMQGAFDAPTVMRVGGTDVALYDSGQRFTPQEMARLQQSPVFQRIAKTITDEIFATERLFQETDIVPLGQGPQIHKAGILFSGESLKTFGGPQLTMGLNIPSPAQRAAKAAGQQVGGRQSLILVDLFNALKYHKIRWGDKAIEELTQAPNLLNQRRNNAFFMDLAQTIFHEVHHQDYEADNAQFTYGWHGRFSGVYKDLEALQGRLQKVFYDPSRNREVSRELRELADLVEAARGRPDTTPDHLGRSGQQQNVDLPLGSGADVEGGGGRSAAAPEGRGSDVRAERTEVDPQVATTARDLGRYLSGVGAAIRAGLGRNVQRAADLLSVQPDSHHDWTAGPPPVRIAPNPDKDLGWLHLVLPPEDVIPDYVTEVRVPLAKFQAWIKDNPKATIEELRKAKVDYLGPAANKLRAEAKRLWALDKPQWKRAAYTQAFANDLVGTVTMGERAAKKAGIQPETLRMLRNTTVAQVYNSTTGFALDTALQNLTQPLLALAHVPAKFLAAAYREAHTPAGRKATEHLRTGRPTDLQSVQDEIVKSKTRLGRMFQRYTDAAQLPLAATDLLNRRVVYLAAKNYAESNGASFPTAHQWAMAVTRKTQGDPSNLGRSPLLRGPFVGLMTPFTKYPTMFASHMNQVWQQEDNRGRQRMFGTLAGLAALGGVMGLDLQDLLISGGRPLGLDPMHPEQSSRRVLSGDAFPVVRAVKSAAKIPSGEVGLTDVLKGAVLPRYPQQIGKAAKQLSTYPGPDYPDYDPKTGLLLGDRTAGEIGLNLTGLRTTRQTARRQTLRDFFDRAKELEQERSQSRQNAYAAFGEAYDARDPEAMAQAVAQVGSGSALRQFLNRRNLPPEERRMKQLPRASRQTLQQEFGDRFKRTEIPR